MLHFEREEFDARVRNARGLMRRDDLDALIIFAQETHYYLTGFDTSGFVFFQCAVMMRDEGPLTLLTRRPDLEQARRTSAYEDIRLWYDASGADPSKELFAIIEEKGLAGARVGIEMHTFGLIAKNYELVRRRIGDWCRLVDASNLVRELRVVKSPAEITYVRQAAELADRSLEAMVDAAAPGVFEGRIAAAGMAPPLTGGGDMPPSGPVLGSGDRALLVRSSTGYRNLDMVDQLTVEHAASYRRYCACLMRTIAIGRANPDQQRMFEVTREAIAAMTEAAKPGNRIGSIDDAHRAIFDENGFRNARMSACGYSLGATYRPSWMDVPPMIYSGNDMAIVPGMILFLHAILVDAPKNLAMSLGYTILTKEGAPEILSRIKPEYVVRT